jgi:hypothetical protein
MLTIPAKFHVQLPDAEWCNTLTTVRFMMLSLHMLQTSLTAQPPDQEGQLLLAIVWTFDCRIDASTTYRWTL